MDEEPNAAPSPASLVTLAALNSRLFLNCLADLADEQARVRPNERTNHCLFLAIHLTDARHFLLRYLGEPSPSPFAALLENARSLDDLGELPPLAEVTTAWKEAAEKLMALLHSPISDRLKEPSEQRFPVDDPTILGGLGFLLHHEAFHIGQMALLRRFVGLPGMSYRAEPPPSL